MNQFLRSLTPTQQVAALFLIVFGILVVVSVTAFLLTFRTERHRARRSLARGAAEFPQAPGHLVVHGGGVLDGLGRGRRRGHDAVRADLVLRAARIHHAVAHAARRPPQPGAGLLRRAAHPVLAGRHGTLRPVHRVHSGLCVPRDPGGQRAGRRLAALPGAQRQAAVGHHGLRLRHEPRARAAAAGFRRGNYQGKGAFLVFFLVFVVQSCMLVQHLATAG